MEAGRDLGKPTTPTHLILLEAKSEFALLRIADELKHLNIRHHLFFEPDDARGHTSLTTEYLTDDNKRKYFSKHSLYKYRAQKSYSITEETF